MNVRSKTHQNANKMLDTDCLFLFQRASSIVKNILRNYKEKQSSYGVKIKWQTSQ